ncbi:MAG TPA: iron ABC transporter permease, partial [Egibacteraceae bacterium]|nr:iron ABC transporter permease [Egibacteraceae bacterium]
VGTGPARGRRRGQAGPPGWLTAAGVAVGVGFAAPLGYLVVRSAADAGTVLDLWWSTRTLGPLARSLLVATAAAAAASLLGTALAWVATRTDVPGGRLWRVLLPLPLVVPSYIGAFALIAAFAPGGLLAGPLDALGVRRLPAAGGFWGAFVVLTLFSYPYVYLPVAARLRQLPPSLEESARLLGHRPARAFRTVVLPQIRDAIRAGTMLVFLYSVSDFGAVQLMRYDTLTRTIYATRLYDPSLSLALSLLLGMLAVGVVAAERAATRRPRPAQAPLGSPGLVVPLRRWRAPAVAFVAARVGLALAAPVGVLVFWAGRGLLRGSARAGALVTDLGSLVGPAVNTATLSVAAAVCAVVAVLPVAYLSARRSRVGGAANALVVGGFALPGLVIALALVFWTLQAPRTVGDLLYQTRSLLVAAYVVHFGAQALRAAQVAVGSLPPRVGDAARTLGAGRLRRLWAVELPLMAPGLLAGGGLVLLSAAKELPATLLLAPAGLQTLATKVWSATEDAFLADASVAALALVVLSGLLTWLLVIRQAEALE